jgi:uracil phosphoribosyltransferase
VRPFILTHPSLHIIANIQTHIHTVQYYNKLPRDQTCDIAYILDPCIATSGTMNATVSCVKKWGAKKIVVICAVAAQSGIDEVLSKHPDVEIHVAAIDTVLSEDGIILPGVGDAGDRQFCTIEDTESGQVSESNFRNLH